MLENVKKRENKINAILEREGKGWWREKFII